MEICEVLVVVDRVTRFDIEEQGVTQDRHDEEDQHQEYKYIDQ